MASLAQALVPMLFAPGEMCPQGYFYIVHKGMAVYGGSKVR